MILVKTKLGKSNIDGIGCFADEDIAKGTVIWRFVPGFDQEFSMEFVDRLPNFCRDQVVKYAYISKKTGNYILCTDDTRFFNHSENNNVKNLSAKNEQEGIDIAIRDIKKGEELLYDYSVFADFDPELLQKL